LADAGGPIDSRVGDLCNHVGFTDVAAPRCCWQQFEQKKSLDSHLRERAERSVGPSLNLHVYFREKCTKTDLLYLKFNSLSVSFALGFESIGPLISTLRTKIGSKVVIRTRAVDQY
jgi:hypothetical protein